MASIANPKGMIRLLLNIFPLPFCVKHKRKRKERNYIVNR
jgi:hypothetical protein